MNSLLQKIRAKTLKTVKVSRDGQVLTYRPIGRQDLSLVTIKVGTFGVYQGRLIRVESIDAENFSLEVSDRHGATFYVDADSLDAVNVL